MLRWLAAVPAVTALALCTGCELPGAAPSAPRRSTTPTQGGSGAHNIGPTASNQWYSSIYKQFPSEPIFVMPLAFQLMPQGLAIGLPQVQKTADTVFGTYIADLIIGFAASLAQPQITSIADWSVGLSMSTAQHQSLAFTLAHGAPFTTLHVAGGAFQIMGQVALTANNKNAGTLSGTVTTTDLAVHVRSNTYALRFDQPAQVTAQGNTLHVSGANRVFVGALDSPKHYTLFMDAADVEITGTRVDYITDGTGVTTTYRIKTTGGTPLITLYPHHQASLQGGISVLGHYASVRGDLALVRTSSFTTRIAQTPPPAMFPALPQTPADLTAALSADITSALGQAEPASRDYYLGVWFGDLDNLLLLAHLFGPAHQSQALQNFMQPKLTDSLHDFTYNSALTSVIATQPEFGNENLNDHHFHYGYYIRTAALLAMLDPSYLASVRDGIMPLIEDIATDDRTSTRFPYLRTFDTYEGHSWADGFGLFADGNDQESSSEAIQAWYAIYLWGKVTGDAHLANLGLYLYAHEVQSTLFYWFGRNGLYTAPYEHAIACIIWGGKCDFATWFSPLINMKYGIEILPITPGSSYLGTLPNFAPYQADYTQHGGNVLDAWGDLFLIFQSFYDPTGAFAYKDSLPASALHVPRAVFVYMLYKNHYGVT
jgi:endoglucanase Acf2